MLAFGFVVLADYPGSGRPWPVRCTTCGKESSPTLRNLTAGHGCRWCAHPRGVCRLDGCDGRVRGQGLCSSHYDRLRLHGDPTVVKRVHAYAADAVCAIDGCDSPPASRGWCSAHWQRWRDHGNPLGGGRAPRVRRVEDHDDGTRTCLDCGERKPLKDYPTDRNATAGRRANCKPCHTARAKEWYAANREEHLPRQRARYSRDIERIRERDLVRYERDKEKRIELVAEAGHRRRARLRGLPADTGITLTALRKRDGDLCHYCRVVMDFTRPKDRSYRPDRATVEHVLPLARGGFHVWENVVLACRRCNTRKNARTYQQWQDQEKAAAVAAAPVEEVPT